MTAMATMPMAMVAGEAQAYSPVQAAPAAQPQRDPKAEYQRWQKRIKAAQELRAKEIKHVWKPTYDAMVGPRVRHEEAGKCDPELTNALAEYKETLLPHLLGDARECSVRVTRVAAAEDAEGKQRFAAMLGDQATALGRAVGLYEDAHGGEGELAKVIEDSFWGMGVGVLGFEPPRGMAEGEAGEGQDRRTELVDLDFAMADRREKSDAGMPFFRHYPCTRFLGDATRNDFTRGDWFAIDMFLTLAETRAAYPGPGREWKKTHSCVPTWVEKPEEKSGEEGYSDGLVCFHYVVTRRPGECLIVPHANAGVPEIVSRRTLDLGLEGLPLRILGGEKMRHSPYPKPLLARGLAAAVEENATNATMYSAGSKIKSGVIVNAKKAPKLAEQLRGGSDQAVYEWTEGNENDSFDDVFKTFTVGALNAEHDKLADRARLNTDRRFGVSDLTRGQREPGKTTATEIDKRQEHVSSRFAWVVKPVRRYEAAVCQGLVAIAYAKLDLLHGMQIPLDGGQGLVAFDSNQPLVGELLDFTFEMEVSDRMTDADEVNQINNMLALLPGLQPLLENGPVPKTVNYVPLVEDALAKSRTPRADLVLVDFSPPPPPPMVGPDGQPIDPGMQQQPQAPPAEEQQPQEADPVAEFEALSQQLASLQEGDPQEDAILARLAELQAFIEQQQPVAA